MVVAIGDRWVNVRGGMRRGPVCLLAVVLAMAVPLSAAGGERAPTRAERIRAVLQSQEQEEQEEQQAQREEHGQPEPRPKSGRPLAGTPQQLLDRAPAGAVVDLPPGTYDGGLVIRKALTVNMRGVDLRGVAWGKAMVVIESPGGPVVINDFSGDGIAAAADAGNLAGVRVSGRDFDVTLARAHIRGTAMGVLTDNRGGVLRIRDSLLEDIGMGDKERSLSHIVYAGLIDRLELSGSTLRRSHHRGHLLKSRARVTRVIDSRLLGGNSEHSRVIDLPCAGELLVDGAHLQRSALADNRDLVALGLEPPDACRGEAPRGSLVLRHSTIELVGGGAGAGGGPVYLFNWAGAVAGFLVEDNTLVTRGLAWRKQANPGLALPPLPASNVEVRSVAGAPQGSR